MGARRWGSGAVACLIGVGVVTACAVDPHPEVTDDHLACASATETSRAIARGQRASDVGEDERAAALLLEVATLQFALGTITPQDEVIRDGAAAVGSVSDPAAAVDAVLRLATTCDRADVPVAFDGAEHTTASCRQLRSVEHELARTEEDDRALGRLRFTARYAQARLGDLDEELATSVRELASAVEVRDRAAADAARTSALDRCAILRDGG